MKRLFTLLTAFLSFSLYPAFAQITINAGDMPVVGDTIRMSTANVNIAFVDPAATGPGYSWNFTGLQPNAQNVEEYVSFSSTPFLYQIAFFGTGVNLANPIEGLDFIPGFELTDTYAYYISNQNSYRRAGYATSAMGIPIPMKFDQPELLYTFPLQYGKPADSSNSKYSLNLPNMGYFGIERKRVNLVDGWGALDTPYGTYEVLRVKSTVYEHDSLYLDTLQMGIPITRNYIEYQWLGKGQGLPLLTVTVENGIMTARYRDLIENYRPLILHTEDVTICQGESVTLSVEVSGGDPPYNYAWSTMETTPTITVSPEVTTTYTVLVTDTQMRATIGEIKVTVIPFERFYLGADTLLCANGSISFDAGTGYDQVRWYANDMLISENNQLVLDSTGIGLNVVALRVEYESGECSGSDEISVGFHICEGIAKNDVVQLSLYPNPAQKKIHVDTKAFARLINYTISTTDGRMVTSRTGAENTGILEIDISALKPGVYQLTVSDRKQNGTSLLIRQ